MPDALRHDPDARGRKPKPPEGRLPGGRPRGPRVAKRARTAMQAVRDVLSLVPLRQRTLVVGGLFLSSLLELFGLTMIIPLLASVAHLREGKLGLVTALREAVEATGLPFHPATFVILIVVGLSLKALVTISVMRYVGELVARIGNDMQLQVVRALLRARWGFFVRQPLGRLTFAAGPEAAAAGECFLSLANILASSLQVLLFIAIAALISPDLATLILVLGGLMFLFFGRLVRQSRRAARQHRTQMRKMAASFTDAMIGIKPLRAMGRTERFNRLFEADAQALSASLRTRVLSGEYASELQEPIIGTLIAVGFFYAASTSTLAPHELLIMGILLVRTVSAIGPIQRGFHKFLHSYDQYRSLKAFVAEIDQAAEVSTGGRPPRFERAITLEEVGFAYGQRPVLDRLSLAIPCGRITTLAGRSGVGKSTTVDLIVGLYRPNSGRVLVDDVDLQELDLAAWRNLIGYVPQEVTLFHTSVLNNVSLWAEGFGEEEVVAALKAAGAWSFVQQLEGGLQHVVGERGHRLSGGQRQRISIARALLHRPRLLILDEATTGLDRRTEAEICAAIQRLSREQGLTVLAISHQPAWQEVADRVYLLQDGRVAEMNERTPDAGVDAATVG